MVFKTTEARSENEDRRLAPAYSVTEATHYLRIPEGTLRTPSHRPDFFRPMVWTCSSSVMGI